MTGCSIKSITDHICVKTRRLTRRSEYKKQTTTSLVKELNLWWIKKDNIFPLMSWRRSRKSHVVCCCQDVFGTQRRKNTQNHWFHSQAASCTQMKTLETNANLQRYTDCPADWCKCECHSLRPEEEGGEEEDTEEEDEQEEEPGQREVVSVGLEKTEQV